MGAFTPPPLLRDVCQQYSGSYLVNSVHVLTDTMTIAPNVPGRFAAGASISRTTLTGLSINITAYKTQS